MRKLIWILPYVFLVGCAGISNFYTEQETQNRMRLAEIEQISQDSAWQEFANLKLFIGKSIWATSAWSNASCGGIKSSVSEFEQLKVLDVQPTVEMGCNKSDYGIFVFKVQKNNGSIAYLPYNFYEKNPMHPTWDKRTKEAVKSRKIFIGMPADAVEMSWGKPQEINRSVGSWGIHEQWVYSLSTYVYFERWKGFIMAGLNDSGDNHSTLAKKALHAKTFLRTYRREATIPS
ncbi:MAG: hypothetical protein WC421_01135 [Elusimicrobiales bacterium]